MLTPARSSRPGATRRPVGGQDRAPARLQQAGAAGPCQRGVAGGSGSGPVAHPGSEALAESPADHRPGPRDRQSPGIRLGAASPPVLAEGFDELRARLGVLPPSSLRPRRVAEDFHVLAVAGFQESRFDASAHVVRATLVDAGGSLAELEHPYHSRGRDGVESLLARLAKGPPESLQFVAGPTRLGPRGSCRAHGARLPGGFIADDPPAVGRRRRGGISHGSVAGGSGQSVDRSDRRLSATAPHRPGRARPAGAPAVRPAHGAELARARAIRFGDRLPSTDPPGVVARRRPRAEERDTTMGHAPRGADHARADGTRPAGPGSESLNWKVSYHEPVICRRLRRSAGALPR